MGKTWNNIITGIKAVWIQFSSWLKKKLPALSGWYTGANAADIEAREREIDAEAEKRMAAAGQENLDTDARITQETAQRQAEINSRRDSFSSTLADMKKSESDARAQAHAGLLTTMNADEQEARNKFLDTRGRAAAKRAEFENEKQKSDEETAYQAKRAVPNINSGMLKGTASGTFSAFEIAGLGNNIAQQQLAETKAMRKAIEQIEENTEEGLAIS
jgi:hypothetical protein